MNGRTARGTSGPCARLARRRDQRRCPACPCRANRERGTRPGTVAWPLFTGLGPVVPLRTAPRLARTFTAMVLGGWNLAAMEETAVLTVSELTTNVVRTAEDPGGRLAYDELGRPPLLWLRLMADSALLGIEVWDSHPGRPGVPAISGAPARTPSPAVAWRWSGSSALTGAGSWSPASTPSASGRSWPSTDALFAARRREVWALLGT